MPAATELAEDAVEKGVCTNSELGVEIDTWTATPEWCGEQLDVEFAVLTIRGVRVYRGPRPDPCTPLGTTQLLAQAAYFVASTYSVSSGRLSRTAMSGTSPARYDLRTIALNPAFESSDWSRSKSYMYL